VDDGPNRRNKAALSSFSAVVWTVIHPNRKCRKYKTFKTIVVVVLHFGDCELMCTP